MTDTAAPTRGRTQRWTRRRAEILDVASAEISLNGARGLTLTAVAKALGLDTSSVTYYFRFKEDLAAACFERALQRLHELALEAAIERDAAARVARFVAELLALYRDQRIEGATRYALLSEMQALQDEIRAPLDALYGQVFSELRAGFDNAQGAHARSRTAVAAHVLLANVFWMAAWVYDYQTGDDPRLAERLNAVLLHGLGGASWPVETAELEPAASVQDAQARFLHAATNLINRSGYSGASVERISAELGVSVGSFYHHLSGKDELVLACFERSFQVMEAAQAQVAQDDAAAGARLGRLVTLLLGFQFSAESPLLRSSAFQTLPPDLRGAMLGRSRAFTLHVAGLVADGVADGSLRPVDPLIAAHAVVAAVHAAADMRAWAAARPLDEAVTLYSDALRLGLGAG